MAKSGKAVNRLLGAAGAVALANEAFATAIGIIDRVSRFQTAMSLRSYMNIVSNPYVTLGMLIIAPVLIRYAIRREHAQDVAEAPRLWTPEHEPERPKIRWFWLWVTLSLSAMAIAGAGVFAFVVHQHSVTSPKTIAIVDPSKDTVSTPVETHAAPQPSKHNTPSPSQLPANLASNATKAAETLTGAPAQPPAVSTPGRLTVTGFIPEGSTPLAYIDTERVDVVLKPPGTAYVVLLVSQSTREKGSPGLDVIQKVVDTLRSLSGVQLFVCDTGYYVQKGPERKNLVVQSGGIGLSGKGIPGTMAIYDPRFEGTAKRIRQAIEGLVIISLFQSASVADRALYQEFWKASGIDIEVVL